MFDIKWVCDNPDKFDQGLARRGVMPKAAELIALDGHRRELIVHTQHLQEQRNQTSKEIGEAKANDESIGGLLEEVGGLKQELQDSQEKLRIIDGDIEAVLLQLPNLPLSEVHDVVDEKKNIEVSRVVVPREHKFQAKTHFELGETLGQMDFISASRMSGSRFVVLRGRLARL